MRGVELEFETAPARGLRQYVRLVAEALNLGAHGYCVQLDPPTDVYLALDGRLARYPTRDVALTWDEEHGWAACIETHSGEDLIVLSYLGTELLPAPRLVAQFVDQLFAEEFPGQPDPPAFRRAGEADALFERLAGYATPTRNAPGWGVPAARRGQPTAFRAR